MNQTNTKVDSNDKRMKIDRIMLKKIVIGKVRGDLFLYISFRFDYRVSSYCYMFFSQFFDPLLPLLPPSFILSSSFISTLHVLARRLVLILVPSAPSQNVHVIAVRLKPLFRYHFHINTAREFSCRAFNAMIAAFFLDILRFSSVLCFCNANPYQ